jgi:hypothetical protein
MYMKNYSEISRRTFLSGITMVGVGSALSTVKLPDLPVTSDKGERETISTNDLERVLLKRLIPQPESVRLNDDREVVLDKTLTFNVELSAPDTQAKRKIRDIFKQYFGAEPVINVMQKNDLPTGGAYKIHAAGTELTLSAADLNGIRYALSTLRQLAEANNNTEKLISYHIPEVEIDDAPAMPFRGIHLCWFPETEAVQIEQYLRWAAYYKFNYIVLEFWGTYPFKSHPALRWQEGIAATPEYIRRLVNIGKDLGMTIIPQLNLFGHASGSRGMYGKHALLDFYPEYQSLFDPDGWVWCLSNPATRKVLSEAVLEMLNAFDNPSFFHVGGDEAESAGECRSCRHADYKMLLSEHLNYFHHLLAGRNCRMMMWHDMLISKDDPRWKGYIANGGSKTENLLKLLPKDIVICDWQYRDIAVWDWQYHVPQKDGETLPTMPYFKEQGFEVLACPWNNVENIKSLGKKVGDSKLDGLLCTTWHSPIRNADDEILNIMMYGAQAAWSKPPYANGNTNMALRHLRQIGWDIPIKKYQNCGIIKWQINPVPR